MGKVAPIPNQTKLLPPHGQAAIKFPISCIQKLVKWPQVIQQSSGHLLCKLQIPLEAFLVSPDISDLLLMLLN